MKKLFIYLVCFIACLPAFSQQVNKVVSKILSHNILPLAGYNVYDGFQLGVGFHNLQTPKKKFTYYAAPAYAFNSKKLTGYFGGNFRMQGQVVEPQLKYFDIGIDGGTFSLNNGIDSAGSMVFGDVYR